MPDSKDISEESALNMLRILSETPQVSQREMSRQMQISLGAVNYCLKALAAKGQIKMRNFRNSQNRQAYAYVLTPGGMSEKVRLTRLFLQRKLEEYERLRAELEAMERSDASGSGRTE